MAPIKFHMNRGFTLLEVMLSAALLSLLITLLYQLLITTDITARETIALADLETQTLNVVERLTQDLLNCSDDPASGFALVNGGFTAAPEIGYDHDTETKIYGDPLTWTLDYSAGELDDGVDNNGNFLVDEMTLTRNDGTGDVVIVSNVAENGFTIDKLGKELTLSLTLIDHVLQTNNTINKNISPVTVTLRN